MDGAVSREEAAARWRLDLEDAEASGRQTWPGDITAGMSDFERLTLVTGNPDAGAERTRAGVRGSAPAGPAYQAARRGQPRR